MELNEREAHCIARLLQGALFGKDLTDGCSFCKYFCLDKEKVLAGDIREHLTEATGVDLGFTASRVAGKLSPMSTFPFERFLKNSSENTKKICREYFETCLEDC